MSKGFKLLRVEYIFSVIVPCLLCIYLNDYDLLSQLWILAGFGFYAITGNTLNDVIDKRDPNEKDTLERVKGYSSKEILTISIASFVLGTACFLNPIFINPIISVYLIITVIMVIVYCLFKSLVVINQIILGVSHIFLPWFIVKINAGDILLNIFPNISLNEWLILLMVTSIAITGQMLHEMIDGDSLSKLSPKASRLVIWISSVLSIAITIITIIVTGFIIFFPVIVFPVGMLYIFRHPRANLLGRSSLKDVGIILGNLFMIFIIILILAS